MLLFYSLTAFNCWLAVEQPNNVVAKRPKEPLLRTVCHKYIYFRYIYMKLYIAYTFHKCNVIFNAMDFLEKIEIMNASYYRGVVRDDRWMQGAFHGADWLSPKRLM